MQRVIWYDSPLGSMLLAADETGVTGVWFEGQKYFARTLEPGAPDTVSAQSALPALDAARRWLDVYFSGREPGFCVPLHLTGTVFQQSVWEILCAIPYGQTITYGEIAKRLAAQRGCARISAQAVGGAVGRNPVSIIVPCHRVIGARGFLFPIQKRRCSTRVPPFRQPDSRCVLHAASLPLYIQGIFWV